MVDDLQAYLDRAGGLGATQTLPPMDMEFGYNKFSIAGSLEEEGKITGLYCRP